MDGSGSDDIAFRSPALALRPRSVAIVGASERARWATTIHANLKKFGYPGAVYPIHPNRTEVWGVPCFRSFAELPAPPEHALFIVPAANVLAALEEAAAAGLKAATVYASGIGEGHDPEIVARGDALRDLCRRTGLIVVGPNCMGTNSLHQKYYAYPSNELSDAQPGTVALVSQSGGTVGFLGRTAVQRGVKYSYMISSGNEIGLDLADYVNFLVDDKHTRVITLLMEGVRRPQAFMAAAGRALAAGKPILALKTGKSQRSREAAQSHTGAIAGDYDAWLAMCERYGVVNCASLDDLVETTLAFQAGRAPKGNRVGFITTSGGTVDLLHDYIEEVGDLVAPDLAPATVARLRPFVQHDVKIANPLDSGIPTGDENEAAMCRAMLDDPNIDMLAWAGTLPLDTRPRDSTHARGVWDSTDKPIIAFGRMYHRIGRDALAFQDEARIPFLQGLQQSVRALSALAFYGARVGRSIGPLPDATNGAVANVEAALAASGIPLPRSAHAATAEAAADAAQAIGFPVAVKIVAAGISHKTEVGGVRLNLRDSDDVLRAARDLFTKGAAGVLVQEMVEGVEVLLGARVDPTYGPVIVVGTGGVFVEAIKDVAMRLLPITRADATVMIRQLGLAKLLGGFRGRSPANTEALIAAAVAFGDFFLKHRGALRELEINPLIVRVAGQGVRAVDVRPVFTHV